MKTQIFVAFFIMNSKGGKWMDTYFVAQLYADPKNTTLLTQCQQFRQFAKISTLLGYTKCKEEK